MSGILALITAAFSFFGLYVAVNPDRVRIWIDKLEKWRKQ